MGVGFQIFWMVVGVVGYVGISVWLGVSALDSNERLGKVAWAAAALLWVAGIPAMAVSVLSSQDQKPFDGYIYRKVYEPAHTNVIWTGKTAMPVYVPDRWYMVLKSTTSDESRACDISHEQYDTYELGTLQHCGGY